MIASIGGSSKAGKLTYKQHTFNKKPMKYAFGEWIIRGVKFQGSC